MRQDATARYANWYSGQAESLMSVGSTPTRATGARVLTRRPVIQRRRQRVDKERRSSPRRIRRKQGASSVPDGTPMSPGAINPQLCRSLQGDHRGLRAAARARSPSRSRARRGQRSDCCSRVPPVPGCIGSGREARVPRPWPAPAEIGLGLGITPRRVVEDATVQGGSRELVIALECARVIGRASIGATERLVGQCPVEVALGGILGQRDADAEGVRASSNRPSL